MWITSNPANAPTRAVEEVYFAAAHRGDLIDDLEHALIVAPEAAAAWSVEWKEHFRESGEELTATIDQANALVTPDLAGAVRRVDHTSGEMDGAANAVADVARQGDPATAVAMLEAAEYANQRTEYVDAVESLVRASRRFFESQLRAEHRDELISVAVAMVVFAATIGAWAVFLRRIRKGQRRLAEELRHRRKVEADLVQAQKMEAMGKMAGGVAHDFNNIVTAIWGSASSARAAIDTDSPAQPALARIEQASEQANEMVRGLMTFGRAISLQQHPVNLASLVDETAALVSPLIPETIAVFVDNEPGHGPWVLADRVQLQEALMNLVLNARDAMPEGGRLGLRVRTCSTNESGAKSACLEVSDSGAGMAAEVQSRIFEPFFTTRGEGGKGTGLGLAIVHSIVTRHGGEVYCESAPGAGAVFTISLPTITAPVDQTNVEIVDHGPPVVADRATVLLVEDHRHVREIIAEALDGAGYAVTAVATGPELLAAQAVRADDLGAMVIDLDIPEPDGLTCTRQIRAAGVSTPIVLITGTPAPRLEAEVGDLARILRKPFPMTRLLEILADETPARVLDHG